MLDVVVDIRVGSPTFGQWDSVLLDDVDRRGIYLGEGLGHAFMSLADGLDGRLPLLDRRTRPAVSTASTRSTRRSASSGRPSAATAMPLAPVLSEKDAAAPRLAEASQAGLLPRV